MVIRGVFFSREIFATLFPQKRPFPGCCHTYIPAGTHFSFFWGKGPKSFPKSVGPPTTRWGENSPGEIWATFPIFPRDTILGVSQSYQPPWGFPPQGYIRNGCVPKWVLNPESPPGFTFEPYAGPTGPNLGFSF